MAGWLLCRRLFRKFHGSPCFNVHSLLLTDEGSQVYTSDVFSASVQKIFPTVSLDFTCSGFLYSEM